VTVVVDTPLARLLRCTGCGSQLRPQSEGFECRACRRRFPVVRGTVRMLPAEADGPVEDELKRRTRRSFAYEWQRFGDVRPQWRRNFLDYLRPIEPGWLAGRRVLDVGTGSGRHSREAAALGAEVVAIDLGDSIDVARRNLPAGVLTIQADAESIPLAEGAFDLVMAIGVLHHLVDTESALAGLVRHVRPGGRLHVYLYWVPPVAWHRVVLRGVDAARRITTRLPHRVLHALCVPLAAALAVLFVLPYRALRRRPRGRRLAASLPLKAYADYPFGVLVNDQFDRLSAPVERRFTREEVRRMLLDAGLEDVEVVANNGWVGDGRGPHAESDR
jgi:SAM-dependent methyltransferase